MNEVKGMEREHMRAEKVKIRVLVVDDSAVMRKLIPGILERDGDIEVVATAIDGDFALNKIEQLKPDVVTLDLDMPRMDGLTTLRHIISRHGLPVVMLSSLTSQGAASTMKALEAGASDFVCKPKSVSQLGEMADELVAKVRAAALTNVPSFDEGPLLPCGKRRIRGGDYLGRPASQILAIGASSGGPHALRYLLPKIPSDFDAGIVIVQHLPESFTEMLAHWLDEICEVEVKEASAGDFVSPGRALIAPASMHMRVMRTASGGQIILERGALVNGHMPSVDVLFSSVAEQYGPHATGLILTGMGCDGADGLGEIKRAGGHTIAQDRESSSVFGMPRVATDRGFAQKVLGLTEMPFYLTGVVGHACRVEETYATSL
jgi:two-component system, chemotaxis family, protein-glutamate methylesterase/glutaminase